MAFLISPGVYVREIDLSQVIPAAATSIGAFAGGFKWGPAGVPVLVTSETNLAANFLKPDSGTRVDFLTAASYLAYSNALRVSRVVADDAFNGVSDRTEGDAPLAGVLVKNVADYEDGVTIPADVGFIAKYPGAAGNSLKLYTLASEAAVDAMEALITEPLETALNKTIYNSIVTAIGTNYPGTSAKAAEAGSSNDEVHIFVVDYNGVFSGVPGTILESYLGVSLASDALTADGGPNYYANVLNQSSAYVWFGNHSTALAAHSGASIGTVLAPAKNFAAGTPATTFETHTFTSGAEGTALADDDYIAAYDVFANPEEVDVTFLITGAVSSTVQLHVVQNIAEVRKDCLAFLSPPRAAVVNNATDVLEDVVDHRLTALGALNTSYAVLDSGWKYMFDKYNNSNVWVPLNADIAGLCARTDVDRDAWWSPAGFNRGNIKNAIKLAWSPNEAQRDALYVAGINPVVSFPGRGTVLFGDKTLLAKPSAFDRINVRRLFIVLEKAIANASQFQLFEFNDQFTRAQFVSLVEPFMRDIQGRRGMYAFRVVCDETNNTPQIIDSNAFIGDIYVQPAKSINFIRLNFIATRTGVDFSEVVGAA